MQMNSPSVATGTTDAMFHLIQQIWDTENECYVGPTAEEVMAAYFDLTNDEESDTIGL